MASPYWTWSEERKDYYHAQQHPETGDWQWIWWQHTQNTQHTTPRFTHLLSPQPTSSGPTAQPSGAGQTRGHNPRPSNTFMLGEPSQSRIRNGDLPITSVTPPNYVNPYFPARPSTGTGGYSHGPESSAQGVSNGGYTPENSAAQGPYHDQTTIHQIQQALDPREFKQRIPSSRFFVLGKVFMMFHIETAGGSNSPPKVDNGSFTTVAHGQLAHHQFRRFVVVEDISDERFCYCCPITTYGGQATTKDGVNQTTHTIVYSESSPPPKLAGETQMNKDPLRIRLDNPRNKLDPKSRINLGKRTPIDHNVKVKSIGFVDEQSLPKLVHYERSIRKAYAL